MPSYGLSLLAPQFDGLYFGGYQDLGLSNIDFLTADVMQLFSNAKITFSQEGATDFKEKYLAPGLHSKRVIQIHQNHARQVYHLVIWAKRFQRNRSVPGETFSTRCM